MDAASSRQNDRLLQHVAHTEASATSAAQISTSLPSAEALTPSIRSEIVVAAGSARPTPCGVAARRPRAPSRFVSARLCEYRRSHRGSRNQIHPSHGRRVRRSRSDVFERRHPPMASPHYSSRDAHAIPRPAATARRQIRYRCIVVKWVFEWNRRHTPRRVAVAGRGRSAPVTSCDAETTSTTASTIDSRLRVEERVKGSSRSSALRCSPPSSTFHG